jgi:CRP/FNR family transcriptional regulator, cyclic AMP receptor protein
MLPIEDQLQQAGLEVVGYCNGLSHRAPQWRHDAVLLEDLSDAETDALGALMPLVQAKPGQVLIREGDLGDWMLLILSGTVDVGKKSEQGETSRLAVVKQGAALGEMSMLDDAPRYASCTAIEAVQAGVLTRATIAHLIQEHPKVGAKLLVKLTQLLAQRLRNTSNQLVRQLQQK